jgi:ribosome biogenesis protein Nip4
LLLYVPTRKMPNLLDTYNTYIEYIEEASFLWTYNAKQHIREISNTSRLKRS